MSLKGSSFDPTEFKGEGEGTAGDKLLQEVFDREAVSLLSQILTELGRIEQHMACMTGLNLKD